MLIMMSFAFDRLTVFIFDLIYPREVMGLSEKCEVLTCSDKVKSCCDCSSPINAKDVRISETSVIGKERSSLGPVTPDINGDSRDPLIDPKSPLTLPNKSDQLDSVKDVTGDNESPHTPKEDVFDPFAPGSDNLLQAPQCRKQLDEWRASVARRLNFGSSAEELEKRSIEGDETCMSDEEIVELMYKNLLETILESRIEDILAESSVEWADDDCKTSSFIPKLSGIAETCPGAPVRAAAESRNLDLRLCRKLQF